MKRDDKGGENVFRMDSMIQEGKNVWSCRAGFPSAQEAERIRAGFIGPVRQICIFADLYREGKELIIEGPDRETVEKIADILNHSVWDS